MNNLEKQYTLNYFDPTENSNKVWIGSVYDDGTFEVRFGRVREAANLAVKRKIFAGLSAALAELDRKYHEKIRKGYRPTSVMTGGETIVSNQKPQALGKLAVEQICGNAADAATAELIEYLAEVNIHQITHSTSIKYNTATGAFSTPLGILTPDAVASARNLLGELEKCNFNGCLASVRTTLICDYFRLVPSDFGAKIPNAAELLATADKIAAQNSILDALDAALQAAAPTTSQSKIFACRLTKLPHQTSEGKEKFREIRALFEKTRNASHATNNLKLTRVYEVEIERMKADFDRTAQKIGNVRQDLWHGTKASNLLSILKNGLVIPKSNAAHCTGRMFGNGIYTSLQSTKALNYATNMWNGSGAKSQKTFMFLTEVALGKTNQPKTRGGSLPKKGTDSTWIEAGTCGVINHECIVYETAQINLKYLCEFSAA